MRIDLPQNVNFIIDTLYEHGFEAYAVGGCVRDSLLGRTPQDWDITTSAKPAQVKAIFDHTIDTGIQHGTVKLLSGFTDTWNTATRILGALKDIIFHFSLNKLGGPVAIYNASSQAAQLGIPAVLSLMAMLSINIGIFNLIPIPALDGGKILINLIEVVRRKPLKQEVETYMTLAGVAVMVILMIAVTWNDIMKLFLK